MKLDWFLLSPARTQCTPLDCIRTSVFMNSSTLTRNPPYACRGIEVRFECEVENGASLQWASEPAICSTMPLSYTSRAVEGAVEERAGYRSYLTSIQPNPPYSNFTSSLTFTPHGSNVTIQCGDQLSSCTTTQDRNTIYITGKYM